MTAAPVLARSLKYSLVISQGENVGKVYSFNKPIITIGRGPQNDVIFSKDPKISRVHVELKNEAGFLKVSNLSDRNFILIDDEKIEAKYTQKSIKLQLGETIIQIKIEGSSSASIVKSQSAGAKLVPMNNNQAPVNAVSFKLNSQPLTPIQAQPQAQPQPPPRQTPFRPAPVQRDNGRIRFYGIILVVGGLITWFVMDNNAKKKAEVGLRTEGDIVRAIEESTAAVKQLRQKQDVAGQNTIQYQSAQEHYVKGFRDYRQRQYARAMQSFQAALSFYPSHELARKYFVQAQRKFEEMVDANMSLGRKNYEKQNYKLCQSSFANVMIMLKDSSKPKYREAKQFYDECSLRLEGRF